jgi:hypothetical protein
MTHLGLNPFEFIAVNQGTLPFKTRVFICYKKWWRGRRENEAGGGRKV